jgi:hypothetical protein
MEIDVRNDIIIFDKELSMLDAWTIELCERIEREGMKYVVMAGYVAILFGRTRLSEDVDVFIEEAPKDRVVKLFRELEKAGYWIVNTENPEEAYRMLADDTPIRIAKKGDWNPNLEVKFARKDLDKWTLEKRKLVIVNGRKLWISPLELEIAYKLFLGSDKDYEDARHLFKIFKDHLNMEELGKWVRLLKVERAAREILGETYGNRN